MGKLLEELKRRKVFRIAGVYAVVGWVLAQVAAFAVETFVAPQWVQQIFVVFLILGFPLALILAWAYEVTPEGIVADAAAQSPPSVAPSSDKKLIYAIFVLALLALGLQLADRFLLDTEAPNIPTVNSIQTNRLTKVSVNIPEDQSFHPTRGDFDISNDGSIFIYRGVDENGGPLLWLRRWDELSGRPLRDTEGATRPKISPDGTEVLFNSNGRVRVVPLNGGLSRTLIPSGSDTPGWGPNGDWVYFHDEQGGVSRIPAQGGEVETFTTVNRDNGEIEHHSAQVLPNNVLLYTVRLPGEAFIVRAANLDGESKDLVAGRAARYSKTGHLLFQPVDEPALLAAPFDLETLEITGDAVPLANGLLRVGGSNSANIGLSDTGRLVYRLGGTNARPGTPTWIDRSGNATAIDPDWVVPSGLNSASIALSPEGERLAISLQGSGLSFDIWVKRLDDGPLSRVTFSGQGNFHPAWSVDGQALSYSTGSFGENLDVWRRNADGSGSAEPLLLRPGYYVEEAVYSPDGRWLVYRQRELAGGFVSGDIYAVSSDAGSEPIPLLVGEYFYHAPTVSPDGAWLSYVSRESGRDEVYVRPFPDVDSGRWQISSDGGTEPVWAHSGKELFYRNGLDELISVQLSEGDAFTWDSQEALFSMSDYRNSQLHQAYAISPDDQRFVAIKLEAALDTELILVDNWTEMLE